MPFRWHWLQKMSLTDKIFPKSPKQVCAPKSLAYRKNHCYSTACKKTRFTTPWMQPTRKLKKPPKAGATILLDLEDGFDNGCERKLNYLADSDSELQLLAILKRCAGLVLDEATSALDLSQKRWIQKSLETLMENRTPIVIAYRLSNGQARPYNCFKMESCRDDHDESSQNAVFTQIARDNSWIYWRIAQSAYANYVILRYGTLFTWLLALAYSL